MKKYEIGIMSSKWSVTAPNIDIAVITVRISQQTKAPIVCYNGDEERSKFSNMQSFNPSTLDKFCKANTDGIQKAYESMEIMK